MSYGYTYLKLLRNIRVSLSLLMCGLMLVLTTRCTNYYRVKAEEEEKEKREAFTEVLNSENYFIVYSGEQRLLATNLEFLDNRIKMELQPVPASIDSMYALHIQEDKRRYFGREGREILHEVRITVEGVTLTEGVTEVPFGSVSRIDIVQHDTGRAIGTFLGVTLGTVVLLGIIVALIKSSCPFVYSHDGEKYSLEGEAFGGAIFAPIERDDYMPLSAIRPSDGKYRLLIRNELKERQYINSVSLIQVDHLPGTEVMTDDRGSIYTVRDPRGPGRAFSGAGNDLREQLFQRDDHLYQFDDPGEEENVDEVELAFDIPPEAEDAKLILNVKGSLWLDYLYGEFISKFGSYYTDWAGDQKSRSRDELESWFFNQNLPLKVFVKTEGEWQLADYVNLIGPLAGERDIVIPLKNYITAQQEQVEVRLQTGFMFWDIDYAAMDFTGQSEIKVYTHAPDLARTGTGEDRIPEIVNADARYAIQPAIGDVLELEFPVHKTSGSSTVFLKIRGYYEHIRDFEGSPDWFELFAFRIPGKFTSFSRERYEEVGAPLEGLFGKENIYADAR